jgi:hypothetical protein
MLNPFSLPHPSHNLKTQEKGAILGCCLIFKHSLPFYLILILTQTKTPCLTRWILYERGTIPWLISLVPFHPRVFARFGKCISEKIT